jgi:hypothetical protein
MDNPSVNRADVVRKLIDTKAVDFAAIGKAVGELGPVLSVADEPWEGFCGTMRFFIRIFILTDPGLPVEDLGSLAAAAEELNG